MGGDTPPKPPTLYPPPGQVHAHSFDGAAQVAEPLRSSLRTFAAPIRSPTVRAPSVRFAHGLRALCAPARRTPCAIARFARWRGGRSAPLRALPRLAHVPHLQSFIHVCVSMMG